MIHAACGRTSMFVPQFSGIFSVSIPLLYLFEQAYIAIRFSMPRSLSIRRMTILVSLEMPSIVVKIAYGNTSFLFTGDAEWDPEHDMVDSGYDLSASLLKVGRHGGGTSSSYVFLREVMPQYAVISVREGNSYGHPSEDTLSRLQDAGTVVYRTDVCGNIIITQIALKITCSAAGSGSSSKKLSFRRAVYQSLKTGITGSAQVGAALGTMTGTFYNNTVTHTLNATTNAALFNAMKAYLAEGNSALVLYNGETSSSSSYSSNYARVTTCVITVTYMDATVWYCNAGTWRQCTVWYCNAGTWIQCAPYYNSGSSWIRV